MSPTDGSEIMYNVIDLVKAGQYIKAIKLHREETGLGLKESKEVIDNLRAGIEMKALKCSSIEEMKDHIHNMHVIGGTQKDFLLDMVEEAYYLGEDAGEQTGYHKALSENSFDDVDEGSLDNAWEEGNQEGRSEGYEDGYSDGSGEGREEGIEEGYENGKLEGYEEGHQAGLEQGRAERNE